mgnify:CR=1 FL=1
MDEIIEGGGQPQSLPAVVGDLGVLAAGKSPIEHSHAPEEILGFGDAAMAASLPETVIDVDRSMGSGNVGVSFSQAGATIPPGVYAAKLESSGGKCRLHLHDSSSSTTPDLGVVPSYRVSSYMIASPQSSAGSPAFFAISATRTVGESSDIFEMTQGDVSARLTLRKII